MRSVFEGTDSLIHEALSLNVGQSLKQKSTCIAIKPFPDVLPRMERLVFDLFTRIEGNWNGRIPSTMNWRLRKQGDISPHNKNPEILLERAIVILADMGILQGWFNQIPVASGLLDEYSNKRAAIDLVHLSGDCAALIELKWESDNPVYAAFEILRYGLAFLFCHKMQRNFSYSAYPLMQVKKISLRVLAPYEYYSYCNLDSLRYALEIALQRLFHEITKDALAIDFLFLSFPPQFRLPFQSGEDVAALKDMPVEAAPITKLLAAMNSCQRVWQEAI